jgi:hypothetical protein
MPMNAGARSAAKAATDADPVGPSHSGVLEAWDSFAGDAPQRPSTKHLYRGIATRFLRWLESQEIEPAQVTPQVIKRFLDGQELSARSKATYRAALRFLFSSLVHGGISADNPATAARLGPDSEKNEELTVIPAKIAPTCKELRACVHTLAFDPIEEGSEDFDAALVLLAGCYLGTAKILPLSRLTGVHPGRSSSSPFGCERVACGLPVGKPASNGSTGTLVSLPSGSTYGLRRASWSASLMAVVRAR